MSSKSLILREIKTLLQEKHDYTEEEAEDFIEEHKEDKVYELLVLKKSIKTCTEEEEESEPDVSVMHSVLKGRNQE